jgi:hypothetical protein
MNTNERGDPPAQPDSESAAAPGPVIESAREDGPALPTETPGRGRFPLRRLIEVLPVLIALTALFSYTTIRGVDEGLRIVKPPAELFGSVSAWVGTLMILVACVGVGGMSWLLYVYTRAPVEDAEGGSRPAPRADRGPRS